MPKLIIFGTGKIGQVAYHHFKTDSAFEIVAFATDRIYLPESGECEGLPVYAFEDIETHLAPADHTMFVAVGYQQMNGLRAERFTQAKEKGYATTSYVSSQNKHLTRDQLGENCFVMSGEPLQPKAKIGDNCFIWTNALVGHHSTVGDHCWITSGVVIGGNTTIGDSCFLGLGATVGHEISVGERCMIGAGALLIKDVQKEGVYIAEQTSRFRLDSSQFLKMTVMK